MRLSNKSMGKIISSDKDEIASSIIFDHTPTGFDQIVPDAAKGFVRAEGSRVTSGFKINELIADQIGVTDKEAELIEERVDQLVVEKLKIAQEAAYKEAYELGLKEGRAKAFSEVQEELRIKMSNFSQLLEFMNNMKKELISHNESHIVKLVTALAEKLAMREIATHPEMIFDVIVSAIEEAQKSEELVVLVSPEDHGFIKEAGGDFMEKMGDKKKLKLEVSEGVQAGGCIVETNYGVIDASIRERVRKLWEVIENKAPQVKEKVS